MRVESLHPFERFIEVGSSTNCVKVSAEILCSKIMFFSSISAIMFTRSAWRRSRMSEVPRHLVIMWTKLSFAAEQIRL